MKQILLLSCVSLLGTAVAAQELGTVISSTAVLQQVAVPRLVCQDQHVAVAPSPSGAGAVVGAIAGGLLGSTIGGGSGQVVATALGVVGGAVFGNQVESQRPSQVQTVQNCSTQTFYQTQATHYDVVYEYAGKRYQVQMAQDPGPTVPLQVTPVGSAPPLQQAPVRAPARIVSSTSYVYPAVEHVTVLPPATTVYRAEPVYSPPSYVAPLAIGLSLGFIGGHMTHRHYAPPPRHYHRPPPRYRY